MGYDVFISYAGLDNQALPGEDGFITKLANAIRVKGPSRLGRKITVWTDANIPAGAQWESDLLQKLWLSRVLVPVISPSWLNSQYTTKEWNEKWADLEGDFFYSNQTCILPVTFQLDEAAQKKTGEQQRTLQSCKVAFFDPMDKTEFENALGTFLQHLKETLAALDLIEKPLGNSRGKVFLGMAFSQQMHRWRRSVRQHLRGSYFDVYQFDWWDNWTPEDISNKCTEAMGECIAAVHFLDSSPGPAGSSTSSGGGPFPIELQLAAGRKRTEVNGGFLQVSWAGPQKDLEMEDPEKRLGALVKNREYWKILKPLIHSANTDSVHEFSKDVLLQRLEELLKRDAAPYVNDDEEFVRQSGKPVACIVYEKNDQGVARKVEEYLKGRGWKVHFPDPAKAKEEFSRRSTFLFYWGSGTQLWCKGNFKDLQRHRTLLNSVGPPSAIALYLGADFFSDKDDAKEKNTLCPGEWLCFTDGDCKDFDPNRIPPRFEEFVVKVEAIARQKATVLNGMQTRVAEP